MEHVLLVGSEDVRAGGHAMQQAAHEMSRAASQVEDSLMRHRQFLDDWLCRLETILTRQQESR